MQNHPNFGALSNQGLCHLGSIANKIQVLSENKIRHKKQLLGLKRKHLHTIPFNGKKGYHTIPLYGKNGCHVIFTRCFYSMDFHFSFE